MKHLFFILIAITIKTYAADNRISGSGGISIIGNGGDVVTCTNSTGSTSAEILDLYEAKVLLGLSPSFGSDKISIEEQANNIVARVERVSPEMKTIFTAWIQTFFQETLFLSGVNLVDIPDSDHIVLPKDCKIQQIANQRIPNTPTEKRYVISKDLWDLLDQNNKTALVLHEIFYRYFIQMSHENSVGARLFNAYIISNSFDTLDLSARLNLLVRIKLPIAFANGLYIKLYQIKDMKWDLALLEFYSHNVLKKAIVAEGEKIPLFDSNLELHGEIEFYPSGKIFSVNLNADIWIIYEKQKVLLKSGRLELYEDGKIKKANFGSELNITSPCFQGKVKNEVFLNETNCPLVALSASGKIFIHNNWYRINSAETLTFFSDEYPRSIHIADSIKLESLALTKAILFYPNGHVESGMLSNDQIIRIQNKSIHLSQFGRVYFYDNGLLKKACLSEDMKFINSDGKTLHLPRRSVFILNEDGTSANGLSDSC